MEGPVLWDPPRFLGSLSHFIHTDERAVVAAACSCAFPWWRVTLSTCPCIYYSFGYLQTPRLSFNLFHFKIGLLSFSHWKVEVPGLSWLWSFVAWPYYQDVLQGCWSPVHVDINLVCCWFSAAVFISWLHKQSRSIFGFIQDWGDLRLRFDQEQVKGAQGISKCVTKKKTHGL